MAEQSKARERLEKRLDDKVKAGELVCPRCGNRESFLVNELGHVFCSKCHSKIPFTLIR